ncbi:OB-fold domain-containing protein [Brevibacillus choshinensis]|uniref:OB-fold domain-containing protein n=1 Tax=Brevibacillus choshinensis TaxID=54911 RepID=UPI002E1ED226|nr:OB-fold domain-containing protein [Brevibacillus choshinensis]
MKGILSYGAYIPYNRLQRNKVKEFFGTSVFAGEKAVASFDEDSVTMGVEAAFHCLQGQDITKLASVHLATASGPYKEKSSIPTLVQALDLPANVKGVELAYSLRSGTSAILAAKANEMTLVIASDCRVGAPSGNNEQVFGDGAVSFLMGSGEGVIVHLLDAQIMHEDIVGQWQSQSDTFSQSWEDRFLSGVLLENVTATMKSLAERNKLTPDSITKVVISSPGHRSYLQVAKKLGFRQEQIQDSLLGTVGAAGSAHALLMLAAALETAQPGEKILVVNFAEGTDILLFEVTEAISKLSRRKAVQEHLAIKNNELSYSSYLKWRGILEVEPPRRPEPDRPSAPAMFRNYEQNLGFYGSRCTVCETPQFPKQRVCVQCQAKDQMEAYRFVGKTAKVMTYTIDYLAPTPAPPSFVAVVDFEGGGRVMCEVTDCSKEEITIGMEVEMTFRRLYEAKGIHNYFWKARPKR